MSGNPLSTTDLARLFGVSRDTIKRWNKEGRIQESGRTVQGWRYYLFTDIEKLFSPGNNASPDQNDQL